MTNLQSTFEFKKYISKSDVNNFIKLTGDNHPLHTSNNYARKKGFKDILVHGMLAGSYFSRLIGKYLPQNKYFYLSQSLIFHNPLYPEQEIIVKGQILHKSSTLGIITLQTRLYNQDNQLIVSGVAKAKLIK